MRKSKPAWLYCACTAALAVGVAACSGGGGTDAATPTPAQTGVGATPTPVATPTPTPTPSPTPSPTPTPTPTQSTSGPTTIQSLDQASTFLNYGTFGATKSDMQSLVGGKTSSWVKQQMSVPATLLLSEYISRDKSGEDLKKYHFSKEHWQTMITSKDQLRQRMAFALSQILVVDDDNFTLRLSHYYDILSRNAFGNYRDILQEVTYSPRMGEYLTYIQNRGDQEDQGRMPDENYAREVLQLFTIGLVELNMDGTQKLGSDGKAIETYDNTDIVGLARVFTGLSHRGSSFWQHASDGKHSPLVMYDQYHSPHEKSFLDFTIPAGTLGDESINQALDHIFEHPNLAPFVSRQLIQRFTASNPSPDYIERVASAFETGSYTARDGEEFGTGERGDLAATIAAVLLDKSLLQDDENVLSTQGKIREPVLRFTQLVRAFDMKNIYPLNERQLENTTSPATGLGQQAYRSPSVFNFYRPGYIAPSTATGEANLTAPEFQLVNASSFIGYNNFVANFIQDSSRQSNSGLNSFDPNYATELAMADAPQDLVDHLDTLLTGGRMLDETKDNIVEAVGALPLTSSDEAEDRLKRVELAIMMAVASPSYFIQH